MPRPQPAGQTDHFKTSDLYFAAYLQVAGVPMLEPEKEGRRMLFVFDTPDLRDLKTEYFTGKSKVPALAFVNAIKNLKSMTHM